MIVLVLLGTYPISALFSVLLGPLWHAAYLGPKICSDIQGEGFCTLITFEIGFLLSLAFSILLIYFLNRRKKSFLSSRPFLIFGFIALVSGLFLLPKDFYRFYFDLARLKIQPVYAQLIVERSEINLQGLDEFNYGLTLLKTGERYEEMGDLYWGLTGHLVNKKESTLLALKYYKMALTKGTGRKEILNEKVNKIELELPDENNR